MLLAVDPKIIQQNVYYAIQEDLGVADYTAKLISPDQQAEATVIAREDATICGIPWAEECFKQIAPNAQIKWQVNEGECVKANTNLCTITGNAREILSAERCTLNFLQTLSATATATRKYVDAIQGTNARIMDTRKTLPGHQKLNASEFKCANRSGKSSRTRRSAQCRCHTDSARQFRHSNAKGGRCTQRKTRNSRGFWWH